jgi:prepilin-type N-terminal cleavage/methylation domain-containing protein/prepilin-type processing-associated H-X9-DG protein
MNRNRGFSFVELLVVVGMLTILLAILLPYFTAARESERRMICMKNLETIMAAMTFYASNNHGLYPSVAYDAAHDPNGYTAYTGADSPDPFAKNTTVSPNDVTAAMWLLVREHEVKAAAFICPSSGDTPDPCRTGGREVDPDRRSNFTDGSHLSYSYSSPYSSAPGYQMDDTCPADFALMADKNPGVDPAKDCDVTGPAYNADPFALSVANSLNHGRAGQNVLYADGHVSFQPTPYCGYGNADQRDNIYTALSPIPLTPGNRPPGYSNGYCSRNVGPSWKYDSYLVPTAED